MKHNFLSFRFWGISIVVAVGMYLVYHSCIDDSSSRPIIFERGKTVVPGYSIIYDYFDTINPNRNDSSTWLVLKEGEIGYYYYSYYHPKIDSSIVTVSVIATEKPSVPIYEKTFHFYGVMKEFDCLCKDSFITNVAMPNSFPALFEIKIKQDNDTTTEEVHKKKYWMNRWFR